MRKFGLAFVVLLGVVLASLLAGILPPQALFAPFVAVFFLLFFGLLALGLMAAVSGRPLGRGGFETMSDPRQLHIRGDVPVGFVFGCVIAVVMAAFGTAQAGGNLLTITIVLLFGAVFAISGLRSLRPTEIVFDRARNLVEQQGKPLCELSSVAGVDVRMRGDDLTVCLLGPGERIIDLWWGSAGQVESLRAQIATFLGMTEQVAVQAAAVATQERIPTAPEAPTHPRAVPALRSEEVRSLVEKELTDNAERAYLHRDFVPDRLVTPRLAPCRGFDPDAHVLMWVVLESQPGTEMDYVILYSEQCDGFALGIWEAKITDNPPTIFYLGGCGGFFDALERM